MIENLRTPSIKKKLPGSGASIVSSVQGRRQRLARALALKLRRLLPMAAFLQRLRAMLIEKGVSAAKAYTHGLALDAVWSLRCVLCTDFKL